MDKFRVGWDFQGANIQRSVRFTEKLFEKLNSTAQQHGISFNLLVLQCCSFALDHLEENQKDG
ncbi:MAG: hypothetical protein IJP37_06320 [Clostridia bacterium]|nr:hypothetical protein [Clostridia bacterium]